jgi:hypothetical protein
MKAYVGIVHEGVCALVLGSSIVEANIEITKNIAIKTDAVLLLELFIFLLFS